LACFAQRSPRREGREDREQCRQPTKNNISRPTTSLYSHLVRSVDGGGNEYGVARPSEVDNVTRALFVFHAADFGRHHSEANENTYNGEKDAEIHPRNALFVCVSQAGQRHNVGDVHESAQVLLDGNKQRWPVQVDHQAHQALLEVDGYHAAEHDHQLADVRDHGLLVGRRAPGLGGGFGLLERLELELEREQAAGDGDDDGNGDCRLGSHSDNEGCQPRLAIHQLPPVALLCVPGNAQSCQMHLISAGLMHIDIKAERT